MRTVRLAELKAHLSEHLRAVQRGATVTVLDRNTPIARIVPLDPDASGARSDLTVRRATREWSELSLPVALEGSDIVSLLRDLREDR